MTTEIQIGREAFIEYLTRVHGTGIDRVIHALPKEFKLVEETSACHTLKDALLQLLVCEISQDYQSLPHFFNVGDEDPIVYYREVLTETPGLDKLREDFDRRIMRGIKNNGFLDPSDLMTNKRAFETALRKAQAPIEQSSRSLRAY